jgi:hypothetical protein
MVVTAKARNRIKDALKEEKRKVSEDGKYFAEKKLLAIGAAMTPHNLEELASFYKLPSALDLFYQIAIKKINLKELSEFMVRGDKLELIRIKKPEPEKAEPLPQKHEVKKDTELIIFGESSDRIVYTLANCCKPIPGDDVFGFVSTGKGLIIHRINCPNATRLLSSLGHRIVKTKWAKNKEISFLTGLKITEVPITLYPDGRSRAPHLRSWRDGWRHLRFMLLFSPRWLFLFPGILVSLIGSIGLGALALGNMIFGRVVLDVGTMMVSSMMLLLGTQLLWLAVFTREFGVAEGLLRPNQRLRKILDAFSLEWGLALRAAGGRIVAPVDGLPAHQDRHRGYHDSDPEYRDAESKKTYMRMLKRFKGRNEILAPR